MSTPNGWTTAFGAVVIADVRWYLDGRSGYDAYLLGHLPGAVFVDLDKRLASPPSREGGRHPLPSPEAFATSMSSLGVGDSARVVAYDDAGGTTAARLVWLLRVSGHAASLLDGGIDAWARPLQAGPPPPTPPATFSFGDWPSERFASADEVASASLVIDARAPARFKGDVEPVDARAGHIPGAHNAPAANNLDEHNGFKSRAALRAIYHGLGVSEDSSPVVYCGIWRDRLP